MPRGASKQGQSIKEAATSNGFADQAHFTRVFKRLVGVPPGAWSKAVHPAKAMSGPFSSAY
jgi:AraC-like DNA-binding protein